jgi:hypothetical protein
MKKQLLAGFLIIITSYTFSATYTSNGNGNWLNPTTWSPMGVPTNSDNVTIYHNVILDTDFALTTGSIFIAEGASLIESVAGRYFSLNGGSIENNGAFTISNLSATAGTFTNNGTFSGTACYIGIVWHNYGNIGQIDSLLNEGSIYNHTDSYIDISRIFNSGTFSNAGVYEGLDFFNNGIFENTLIINLTNFTNADTATNSGNIAFWNCTNIGGFFNTGEIYGENSFSNLGFFHNSMEMVIDYDFFNGDTANNDAYYYNAGFVSVGNNFLNINTIDGSSGGRFCVDNLSGNEGLMTGSFEFCDNSNPGSLDYNIGTIDPTVTYCSTACETSADLAKIDEFAVYPVPASDVFNVFCLSNSAKIQLYDITGKIVFSENLFLGENNISCSNLFAGTYLYRIISFDGIVVNGKLMIER